MKYEVEQVKKRLFSGTLDAKRLQETLNTRAAQGWTFQRQITDSTRVMLIFKREVHFLVFQRSA